MNTAVIFEKVRYMDNIIVDLHGITTFDWSLIIVTEVMTRLKLLRYAGMPHYSSSTHAYVWK
jgi:hypothetical protein